MAVANALPALKATATLVTSGARGAGVSELVDRLLATDLHELDDRLSTRHLPLGRLPDRGAAPHLSLDGSRPDRRPVRQRQIDGDCRLARAADPMEGISSASSIPRATIAIRSSPSRSAARAISALVDEALFEVLARPAENVAVNLLDIALANRSDAVEQLLARLVELRARTARPHWIVLDEAHHALPAAWARTDLAAATRPGLALNHGPPRTNREERAGRTRCCDCRRTGAAGNARVGSHGARHGGTARYRGVGARNRGSLVAEKRRHASSVRGDTFPRPTCSATAASTRWVGFWRGQELLFHGCRWSTQAAAPELLHALPADW